MKPTATGMFKTREELVTYVIKKYYTDRVTITKICQGAKCSSSAVNLIVKNHLNGGNGAEPKVNYDAVVKGTNEVTNIEIVITLGNRSITLANLDKLNHLARNFETEVRALVS